MDTPDSEGLASTARNAGDSQVESIVETAKAVVATPAEFFKNMPTGGGFADPVLFVVAMGVAVGLVRIVLSLLGLGFTAPFGGAFVALLLTPIFAAIFSFVGGGVLFLIWRLLGSQHSYETAYRCGAYMTAITPITTIFSILPYLGSLGALVWALILVVTASEQVHKIAAQTARTVFGIIFVVLALLSIGSQRAANKMGAQVDAWNEKMDGAEDMSPEEAGRDVGEFLKGLQDSVEKDKQPE